MRNRYVLSVLTFLLLATGTAVYARDRVAPSGEERLTEILAGLSAGTPINCINLREIRSTRIVDSTAIVYETSGRRLYVNRPDSGAELLRQDDILVTKTSSNQLCSLDIVRLVSQGSHFERGSVGLGQFVPYAKPTK